jgi:hypothetical protein
MFEFLPSYMNISTAGQLGRIAALVGILKVDVNIPMPTMEQELVDRGLNLHRLLKEHGFHLVTDTKEDQIVDEKYYIVYKRWDSTGPSPTIYRTCDDDIELSDFLVGLDRDERSNGMHYKIILIVKGEKIDAIPQPSFKFNKSRREYPSLQKDKD